LADRAIGGRLASAVAEVVRWATRAESRHALHGAGEGACSPTEAWLLQQLAQSGSVRMSSLAEWQGVDRSTMTVQIRRLADRGLVSRRPDPADARAVLIDLTARGRDMVAEERNRADQIFAEAVADWDPADRDDLRRLLAKLAQRLQSRTS